MAQNKRSAGTVPRPAKASKPRVEKTSEQLAADADFTRRQFWFLRQVVADRAHGSEKAMLPPHKLAVPVAVVLADHANRDTGLTFPSQATIAQIIDSSARSVRGCIASLVSRGHLVCAGWLKVSADTHVKAYLLNPTDPRVEQRFDKAALATAAPGKNSPRAPDGQGAATRPNIATSTRSTRQDFAGHLAKSCHPPGNILSTTRRDLADKPSYEPSNQPSDEPSADADRPSKMIRDEVNGRQQTIDDIFASPSGQRRSIYKGTDRLCSESDIDRVIALFGALAGKRDREWIADGFAELRGHDPSKVLAALRNYLGRTPEGHGEPLFRHMRKRPMASAVRHLLEQS